MSRRLIWAAVGLVAVSTPIQLAADPARPWAERAALPFQILLAALAMTALVAMIIARYKIARHKSAPAAGLEGSDDHQIAPTSRFCNAHLVLTILFQGYLSAYALESWREDPGADAVILCAAAIVLVPVAGWLIYNAMRGVPRLEVTPEALLVIRPSGSLRIPWRALSQTSPIRGIRKDRNQIHLNVTDYQLIESSGLGLPSGDIHLSDLTITPQVLAELVRLRVAQA